MKRQPEFEDLLKTSVPAELGPEPRPGTMSQDKLEQALAPVLDSSGLSADRKGVVRSLLLLWHDHLDASHEIAQSIETVDGAFVHGIMHRREPDFGNAAYWFRRVGDHKAFSLLASKVEAALHDTPSQTITATLIRGGRWDPFGFINACQAAAGKPHGDKTLLRQIQQLEFEALLMSVSGDDAL